MNNLVYRNLQRVSIAAGLVLAAWFLCLLPHSLEALEIEEIYKRTGRPESREGLTITVQDAEIQSVLKAISQQSGLNIVSAQGVEGKISVHLYNAPLQEVLDSVITMNGYHYLQENGTLYVTKEEGEAERNLHGREIRAFQLNYVDIEVIEKNIKDIASSTAMITIYKPRKTLIVEDASPYLDRIEKVLRRIDVPPRQVLIEAKILEIRLNDDTSLGIDWNYVFSHSDTSGNLTTFGFTDPGSTGLFFQSLGKNVDVFLDTLQTKSNVNTLSTPTLIALDNKEAKIIVGGKLGYFVTTATNSTVLQTVEFLEIGTQLTLIPQIMDDGKIIMEIHPEVSDGSVTAGLPTETTTEVTTTLIADDGGTIFLGGLIRDRKEDIRDHIPGLGWLPGLGMFFGKTTNTTQKNEIIVLITPHILYPDKRPRFQEEIDTVKAATDLLKQERTLKELIPGTK